MRAESLAAAILALSGCISPSVVASSGRAVVADETEREWRAAQASDFEGAFESERIDGPVAAALARVAYVFADDGFYSGAALVLGGEHPEFQTLSGSWRVESGRLVLDDAEPADAFVSGDRLKLTTPEGTLVLVRRPLE